VDVFLLINELVTLLSLLESTLVLFLHHYESDSLLPSWLAALDVYPS